MLKALIKKQLLELFQTYFVNKKTGKARSKKSTALFFVLFAFIFVFLGFAFYAMSSALGGVILSRGCNWLYFAIIGLISMAFGVFGSVFNTFAQLYLPKDNEQMMSLPIPEIKLLLSRVAGVYTTSFMYSFWVWLPALIFYWQMVTITPLNVFLPLLSALVIGLFVTVLSCALGWLVALVSTKTKGKSIISALFSVAFLAAYYVVYFKVSSSIKTIQLAMTENIDKIGDKVKLWLRYLFWLGEGADGDIASFLIVTLITAALFLVCLFILSKTFTKLASATASDTKKAKVPSDYSEKSLQKSLFSRELKHFTSVTSWLLNGGLGILIMPVGAVALLVKRETISGLVLKELTDFPVILSALPFFVIAVACMVISMDAITASSVSLEGSSLWLLQTLPVDPREILQAKSRLAVRLSVISSLIFVVAGNCVLRTDIAQTVLSCCIVFFYINIVADGGLLLNLKAPNFSWTNVNTVTKQSMPVCVNLFGGWLFSLLLGGGGFLLCKVLSADMALTVMLVLMYIIWNLLHRLLYTKGVELFKSL